MGAHTDKHTTSHSTTNIFFIKRQGFVCLSYIDGFCILFLRYSKGKVQEVCSFGDAVAGLHVVSAHCNLNRK